MKDAYIQQFERLMIVVWRWKDPGSNDALQSADKEYDVWSVEDDDKAAILRIDPCDVVSPYNPEATTPDALEKSVQRIESILKQRPGENRNTQVFLHLAHKYTDQHKQALLRFAEESNSNCKVNTFQFTDSPLYISPKTRFGLLGGFGNWGDTLVGKETYCAKKGEKLIVQKHFDFVWDFFQRSPQAKAYNLKQSLQMVLIPVTYNKAVQGLYEYAQQIGAIRDEIGLFLIEFSEDEPFKPLCSTLDLLKKMLENNQGPEQLKNILQETIQKTEDLLNRLPTNHIYV